MRYRVLIFGLFIACLLIGTASADTLIDLQPINWATILCNPAGNATFSDLRNCGGTSIASDPLGDQYATWLVSLVYEDQFDYLQKFGISYNGSIIGESSTIISAKQSFYSRNSYEALGANYMAITKANPADPTTFVAGDYDSFEDTYFSGVFQDMGAGFTLNISLNNDGIAAINKTGIYSFFFRYRWDIDNNYNGTWVSDTASRWRLGLYNTPPLNFYMEIEYTPAAGGDPPVASFTTSKTFVRIPQSITFTDTSTETPDEWLWDFGDGTTSTDQNPVHKYTKRGKWNVTLNATNDDGSDTSDITTVRVVGYEIHY